METFFQYAGIGYLALIPVIFFSLCVLEGMKGEPSYRFDSALAFAAAVLWPLFVLQFAGAYIGSLLSADDTK